MKRTAAPTNIGPKRIKSDGYDEDTDQIVVPKYKWHAELNALLAQPPDTNRIIWVVDRVGGDTGKTMFFRKFDRVHPTVAKRIPALLSPSTAVIFLDRERNAMFIEMACSGTFTAYGLLRQIKEGSVISKKITFGPTHVVIMSYKEPEREKLAGFKLKIVEATREVLDE